MKKRYQECNVFVRLFRRWHYVKIPFLTFNIYFRQEKDDEFGYLKFIDCYKIAKSICQVKMNWVYTMDEVKKELYEQVKI